MQANIQSENTQVKVETTTTTENSYFGKTLSNSLVLLYYEMEVSLILDSLLKNPLISKVKQRGPQGVAQVVELGHSKEFENEISCSNSDY